MYGTYIKITQAAVILCYSSVCCAISATIIIVAISFSDAINFIKYTEKIPASFFFNFSNEKTQCGVNTAR